MYVIVTQFSVKLNLIKICTYKKRCTGSENQINVLFISGTQFSISTKISSIEYKCSFACVRLYVFVCLSVLQCFKKCVKWKAPQMLFILAGYHTTSCQMACWIFLLWDRIILLIVLWVESCFVFVYTFTHTLGGWPSFAGST